MAEESERDVSIEEVLSRVGRERGYELQIELVRVPVFRGTFYGTSAAEAREAAREWAERQFGLDVRVSPAR
jgi:hypothetical protein